MREKIVFTLYLNASWNYFVSAIDLKIQTRVARQISKSLLLLLYIYFIIDKMLSQLGIFTWKSSPLLHVRAMCSCNSLNNICQGYLPSSFISSLKHTKYTIFWSTPNTSLYEARQPPKRAKFIEHTSSPRTWARKACQTHEHASTPFSRLVFRI